MVCWNNIPCSRNWLDLYIALFFFLIDWQDFLSVHLIYLCNMGKSKIEMDSHARSARTTARSVKLNMISKYESYLHRPLRWCCGASAPCAVMTTMIKIMWQEEE